MKVSGATACRPAGNLVSFSLGVTMMGIAAYLPVYIQGVMGESAMTAGFIIMSMSATSPFGAVLAGQIMLLRFVLPASRPVSAAWSISPAA